MSEKPEVPRRRHANGAAAQLHLLALQGQRSRPRPGQQSGRYGNLPGMDTLLIEQVVSE